MSTEPSEERDLIVAHRAEAADGVVHLVLVRGDGGELPEWLPGAHLDLGVEIAGEPLRRQYSLCGDPSQRDRWEIAVLREPEGRGGSEYVHDYLQVSAPVRVWGPRNNFPFVDEPRYTFIAGGIGVTPILPMIAAADRAGADWTLYYGGRRRTSMAFTERLAGYGERVVLWPEDERGLLDLPAILGDRAAAGVVYCCGPEALLAAVEKNCEGWPEGALRVERFRPAEGLLGGAEDAFEVEFAESGITVEVAAGQSILDAAQGAGIEVDSSCTEGTCGTCETVVLSGEIDHRDSVLSASERAAGDVMMVCVSRARCGRLVLEL
ncbi:PDR/VanB family oxidoreductase [Pseudonocardia sp. RS010]|uniref:PDR/VanB family oxidoreductase n=1 Tax=Pseudonocardia sp. RS010 TaxID=3385979 RepID=UPI0039A1DDA9